MSTPKMYTWRDADAPAPVNNQPGTLVQVLRKCLAEGYGSGDQERTPPGDGWELQVDGTGNRIALRSNNPSGAGHWYYIDDTGDYDGNNNDGDGAEVAAMIGAETFDGWDGNGDPILGGVFGDNGTLSAQWFLKPGSTDGASWIVVADDRTCYFYTFWRFVDKDYGWDAVNASASNMGLRGTASVFGDYTRFDAHGGSASHGFVAGANDNRSVFGKAANEATPETSDDITDPDATGALMIVPPLEAPSFNFGVIPSIGVGPHFYQRQYIGQDGATTRKGALRGLRATFIEGTTDNTQLGSLFPDLSKMYGEASFGGDFGDVFYLAFGGETNSLIPHIFLRSNWDDD